MRVLSEVLRIRSGTSKLPASFTVFLAVVLGAQAFGKVPSQILLEATRCRIRVGEPLLVRLSCKWDEPVFQGEANEPLRAVHYSGYLHVTREDTEEKLPSFRIHDESLLLQDQQGYLYRSGYFVIFYHWFGRRLIFERPGVYHVYAEGWTKTSNALRIEVQPPSELQRRALRLIGEPNDYRFLLHPESRFMAEPAETMAHLKRVADECGATLLGRWCAARLGSEYFERFHEKNPSFDRFSGEYRQGRAQDAEFEKAYRYLSQGMGVPDELPIREEVLYKTVTVEIIRADYDAALSHAQELCEKYPKGRYGRMAERRIRHISELQEKQTPAPEEKPQRTTATGILGVVVGGIGVAIAAGVVLVVLLRKKPGVK